MYIGQSGNFGKRLVQHNQDTDRGKDFWNRALVVVSLTNSMTQTHALFLEWFAIGQATQAGRYSLNLQQTVRQRRRAAPHARAARGRLPRNPRDRRHPAGHAGHAGPADF